MNGTFKKQKTFFLLTLITLVGIFFYFYNLNWGAPFYFNPDERNIASAVSQLQFPHQMNPHFFAYGSLPIYAIYFTSVFSNIFLNFSLPTSHSPLFTVSFEQAVMTSRAFSALFATFLISILYFVGRKLKNERVGLFTAFFAVTSAGFIQFAHFGTFEMWLTFFSTILFFLCINYLEKPQKQLLILMAITFGILMSTKVSSLVFLPLLMIIFIVKRLQHHNNTFKYSISAKKGISLFLLRALRDIFLFSLVSLFIFVLTNPYVVLDQPDFLSSMHYESRVAIGTLPVFYTGNFLDTTPILYQFLHVYPFLINPLMTFLFIIASLSLLYGLRKQKSDSFLLLAAFYAIVFISQAFLFVKWTRYMMPTIPFMFLIIAIVLNDVLHASKKLKQIAMLQVVILVILNSLAAFSYFKTAFINPDTRLEALLFAQRHVVQNATILTEPSDLGVMPFQDAFTHVDTFNFYDLDNNSPTATETILNQKLSTAHYLVIPSQRLLQSRMENPKRFPLGHRFYVSLLNGSLGFDKIYETPCDLFCTITYLGDPVYWWEQTTSVFDRPTVFIFKRQ